MFSVEFSSSRPAGSAPYYSLVVREDPYVIGHDDHCDIHLTCVGIAGEHARVVVMRESEATRLLLQGRNTEDGEGSGITDRRSQDLANADFYNAEANTISERDPLVVRLTALAGDGTIHVDTRALSAGESVLLSDGAEVTFGEAATSMVFRFRPLVVSIEEADFTSSYVSDLVYMFHRLGATVSPRSVGPSPFISVSAPIVLLHCADRLQDTPFGLLALASGYSVVQPTYVLEWFAALAQSASSPLSVLPPPSGFEVAVVCARRPAGAAYMRPESDTCPFSLYPIPSTAMQRRSREGLFSHKTFLFFSQESERRYSLPVRMCGGTCIPAADIEAAKGDLRERAVVSGGGALADVYAVVDSDTEAAILNQGVAAACAELAGFLEEMREGSAAEIPLLGDRTLFTSLLCNVFHNKLIAADEATVGEPIAAAQQYEHQQQEEVVMTHSHTVTVATTTHQQDDTLQLERRAVEPYMEEDEGDAAAAEAPAPPPAHTPYHYDQSAPSLQQPYAYQGGGSSRRSHLSAHRSCSARRASLLPRDATRTPSRCQMRSYSKQRARSASADPHYNHQSSLGSARTPRGRRQLVVAPAAPPASFVERFDLLRIRLYAYLMREETVVDGAIVSFQRNNYISAEMREHALEVRAQAQDFMEKVDDLLDESHGAYTESLRQFWWDCSDLDLRAQYLFDGFDRQSAAVAYRRGSIFTDAGGSVTRGRSGGGARRMSLSAHVNTQRRGSQMPILDMAAIALAGEEERHVHENEQRHAAMPLSARGRMSAKAWDHRDAYLSIDAQHRLNLTNRLGGAPASSQGPEGTAEGATYPTPAATATTSHTRRNDVSMSSSSRHRSQSPHAGRKEASPPPKNRSKRTAATVTTTTTGGVASDSPNVVRTRSAPRRSQVLRRGQQQAVAGARASPSAPPAQREPLHHRSNGALPAHRVGAEATYAGKAGGLNSYRIDSDNEEGPAPVSAPANGNGGDDTWSEY